MRTWISLAALLLASPAFAAGNGLSGGGANGGGGGGPTQTATNGSDGQAPNAANQQSLDFNMIWNGTSWDRLRGTGGALNAAVTSLPSLPAGSNLVGKFGIDQTTPGTTNAVAVTLSTPEGALSDPAWAGSGNGSVIAVLKALYGQAVTTGTLAAPSASILSVTQPPLAPLPGSALESCHVFRSAATNVHGLDVTIGATAGWVMIFDAAAAPSNGAVTPKKWFPIPSNGTFGGYSGDFSATPLLMTTGFVACFSTTGPFTFTGSATAAFNAQAS